MATLQVFIQVLSEKKSLDPFGIMVNHQNNSSSLLQLTEGKYKYGERSGSVVECLTRDRGVAGSASLASLRCGPWARHIYPSLLLVQLKKTRTCLIERLLMGRKESNQTNIKKIYDDLVLIFCIFIALLRSLATYVGD